MYHRSRLITHTEKFTYKPQPVTENSTRKTRFFFVQPGNRTCNGRPLPLSTFRTKNSPKFVFFRSFYFKASVGRIKWRR